MSSTISAQTVEYFAEKTVDLFQNIVTIYKDEGVDFSKLDFNKIIKNHYTEVVNWSFDIPFIGLSQRKQVEKSTIELNISSRISKYGKDKMEIYFSERELLNTKKNIVILGKPGAGKTTTVKRLVNSFFLNIDNKNLFTTAILIRLRELENAGDIYTSILDIFNIKTELKTTIIEEQKTRPNGDFFTVERKITRLYLKSTEIIAESFLVDFLNITKSIIFLDGFDEISASEQKKLLQDTKRLGFKFNSEAV